jgi:hypothetical protein
MWPLSSPNQIGTIFTTKRYSNLYRQVSNNFANGKINGAYVHIATNARCNYAMRFSCYLCCKETFIPRRTTCIHLRVTDLISDDLSRLPPKTKLSLIAHKHDVLNNKLTLSYFFCGMSNV